VKHKTDNSTNYGHSKGKIEYGETIKECAAREVNKYKFLKTNM
jgi:8-oxo-dGTP pyrophosphatase MutT (NUDIX family)